MYMLRLSLIGNLGVEPEIGTTQKGTPIATLRVAVNHQRTDTTTGERHEQTEWFRVRAMGRLVEPAGRLSKGNRVLVVGRFDIGHYLTREGEPRQLRHLGGGTRLAELAPRHPRRTPRSRLRSSTVIGREPKSARGSSARAANRKLHDQRGRCGRGSPW